MTCAVSRGFQKPTFRLSKALPEGLSAAQPREGSSEVIHSGSREFCSEARTSKQGRTQPKAKLGPGHCLLSQVGWGGNERQRFRLEAEHLHVMDGPGPSELPSQPTAQVRMAEGQEEEK